MTAPVSFRQCDAERLLKAARKQARPEDTIRLTVAPDGTLSLTMQRQADNDDGAGTGWEDA